MMDKRANQVEMYAERTSTNKVESGGQLSTGDEISAYSNTPSTVDSILSNLPDHHHPPHNVYRRQLNYQGEEENKEMEELLYNIDQIRGTNQKASTHQTTSLGKIESPNMKGNQGQPWGKPFVSQRIPLPTNVPNVIHTPNSHFRASSCEEIKPHMYSTPEMAPHLNHNIRPPPGYELIQFPEDINPQWNHTHQAIGSDSGSPVQQAPNREMGMGNTIWSPQKTTSEGIIRSVESPAPKLTPQGGGVWESPQAPQDLRMSGHRWSGDGTYAYSSSSSQPPNFPHYMEQRISTGSPDAQTAHQVRESSPTLGPTLISPFTHGVGGGGSGYIYEGGSAGGDAQGIRYISNISNINIPNIPQNIPNMPPQTIIPTNNLVQMQPAYYPQSPGQYTQVLYPQPTYYNQIPPPLPLHRPYIQGSPLIQGNTGAIYHSNLQRSGSDGLITPHFLYAVPYFQPKRGGKPKNMRRKNNPKRKKEAFIPELQDHGEHNALNEEYIQSVIKDYEEKKCDNIILKGKMYELAVTQTGSRFLQKMITKANPPFVQFVLEELGDVFSDLMVDDYANYFCQKFLHSCSPQQRLILLKTIQPIFMTVCKDKKGTHTIQAFIDLLNLPEEEQIINQLLKGHIVELALDHEGTHVVVKLLMTFSETKALYIYNEILTNFLTVAIDANGINVIKKLVGGCTDPNMQSLILAKITDSTVELVQNPYGNYAIQAAIDNWETESCIPLYKCFIGKTAQLSIQKSSSNVMEKCLEKAPLFLRNELLLELANLDQLSTIMRNSFGNYVIQKSLKLATGEVREKLIECISENIPNLIDKNLKVKWRKLVSNIEGADEPYKPSRGYPLEQVMGEEEGDMYDDDLEEES